MVDKTLLKEIKKTANGDGSREAKFTFLKSAREAAKEMSNPTIRDCFHDIVSKYGRATIAICLAASVVEKEDRLEENTV